DKTDFTFKEAVEKINRAMQPHSLRFTEVEWFSQFSVKESVAEKYFVKLLNLDMPVPLEIMTSDGLQKLVVDKKGIEVKSKTYIQVDPRVFYIKKVIME
ncbi:MAG TPA: hypothetical protein P5158_08845, partial [Chitinophagaceae bacterium]|nr:hypothetical protein [Chitinophagaceae bacterium]